MNSEYVKELMRKELMYQKQARDQLRNLLLQGVKSKPAKRAADWHYFQKLRDSVQILKAL